VLAILKRTNDLETIEAIDKSGCSALALAMSERQLLQRVRACRRAYRSARC
jgi:hypothetical protein